MAPPRKSHVSVSTFEEHPAPRPGRAAKCDGGVGTLVNRGISNSMSRCLPGLRRVPAGSGTFERRTRSHRIRRFPTFGAPHATFSSQSCEYAEKARKPIKNQLRLSIGHLKPGNTEVTSVSGPYSPQGQPGGGPYGAPSGGPYGAANGSYGAPGGGGQYGQQPRRPARHADAPWGQYGRRPLGLARRRPVRPAGWRPVRPAAGSSPGRRPVRPAAPGGQYGQPGGRPVRRAGQGYPPPGYLAAGLPAGRPRGLPERDQAPV